MTDVNANSSNRFYTPDELGALSKKFKFMIEGQGIAFILVDPSPINRRILLSALQKAGFLNLHEAKNCNEGLEIATKEKSPQIITIADDAMTGMTGMDYLTYAEKLKKIRADAIIFFTGSKFTPAKITDAVKCGVSAVFSRPLKIEEIFAKFKQMKIVVPQ